MKTTVSLTIVCTLLLSLLLSSGAMSAVTVEEYVNTLVNKAEEYSRNSNRKFMAITFINEAIKLQPRNRQLYYKRAFILGRAGLYGEAIKAFTQFVNARDGYPHAVRFRADCYMAILDMPRAIRDYQAFLANAPKDGKVWSYLAEAYALMGEREAALRAIMKGLATGSHWSGRLESLKEKILFNQRIEPHQPLSN